MPVSRSDTAPPKSRAKGLRVAAACVVLLAIAGYVAAQYVTSSTGPARCTVSAAGEGSDDYEIKPEQAANAATITAVASRRDLPERAVTIALATSMQESALRNIPHGDRDSLGLFQQRPSQGWGTEREISDPVYSTGRFYDHLVRIPGYSRLPLTVAAQRVQHSGYPQAYAKHEANAALLTAALTGRRAAAFTCTTGPGGGDGKAGSAARVRERLVREFGAGVLPGRRQETPASGTGTAAVPAAAEADGGRGDGAPGGATRTRSEDDANSRVLIPVRTGQRGWELAHWAVANSEMLHITQVSYGNRLWDSASSEEGWRTREGDSGGRESSGGTKVTVRVATGQ